MQDVRRAFHEEIETACTDVVRLAGMASEAIQAGTTALLQFDLAGAERVVVGDADLDSLTHSIENHCFLLLARQQPTAIDLRTIVSILRIIHELERIGDLMVNTAKATRRLYPEPLEPRMRGLLDRMREQATQQLQVATDSFADRDVARALALRDMDDVMDELQRDMFRAIFSKPAEDEAAIQRAVQIALVGRYFERIADHAVNVGERVDFMVTGHFPEPPPGDGATQN